MWVQFLVANSTDSDGEEDEEDGDDDDDDDDDDEGEIEKVKDGQAMEEMLKDRRERKKIMKERKKLVKEIERGEETMECESTDLGTIDSKKNRKKLSSINDIDVYNDSSIRNKNKINNDNDNDNGNNNINNEKSNDMI